MLLTETNAVSGTAVVPRFPLALGGELRDVRIAYEVHGENHLPAIVVLGGISAGRHITPGWWADMVGAGRPVDTDQYCVIGIDFIGGCGASTRAAHNDFPAVSTSDQAHAVRVVLDALAIGRLACFIGSSYGGMVALAFAERYPARVARVIAISAPHQTHPMATALRSLQRRTIRLGLQTGRVNEAVAIARGVAMTTYRTAAEFAQRFDTAATFDGSAWRHPVESYIEDRGRDFARRFDAAAFLCLSQSTDLHSVDPARIRVPVTLVGVDSDTLVPVSQLRQLATLLGARASIEIISSIYGHDAFLKEVSAVSTILRSTLSQDVAS